MKNHFLKLWTALKARNIDEEYVLLIQNYSSHGRYYHNLSHIQRMLTEFNSVREMAVNSLTVELAIWYHDIIYDVHRSDNEERSAQFLKNVGYRCGIEDDIVDTACTLILDTKHIVAPQTIDGQIIADCDLTSLGQSYEEFNKMSMNIWKEYSSLGKELFVEKRIAILQQFLNRTPLYHTNYFREKYALKAKENLRKAISTIQ